MVFVGYGLSIPDAGWDDLAGQDLRGKIAVYVNAFAPVKVSDNVQVARQHRRRALGGREARRRRSASRSIPAPPAQPAPTPALAGGGGGRGAGGGRGLAAVARRR